tara:strand:+ start:3082 stop:3291 length:210 start_codon:yes stop_codon:yes gene_type:complete
MPARPIEIDLAGPDGNAFSLMKWAEVLGYQLGYSRDRVAAIRKVMMMGDYDGLLKVFDDHFGHMVTLYK